MSAIRKLAAEAADKGLLAPELAQGISRVKSVKSTGIRVGNWLSQRQAQTLLAGTRTSYVRISESNAPRIIRKQWSPSGDTWQKQLGGYSPSKKFIVSPKARSKLTFVDARLSAANSLAHRG